MLGAVHAVAATWFGVPYLALEDEEADRLGKAVERVLRFHGVRVISPMAQAYWGLGSAMAAVYGKRIAYANELRQARREAQAATEGTQTASGTDDGAGEAHRGIPGDANGATTPTPPKIDPDTQRMIEEGF